MIKSDEQSHVFIHSIVAQQPKFDRADCRSFTILSVRERKGLTEIDMGRKQKQPKLQKMIDFVVLIQYNSIIEASKNSVVTISVRHKGSQKMTSPDSYTTAEVAQAIGFTVRQLDYWAQQGVLVPSIQQSRGPGTHRLYSVDDLIQLQFIRQLRRYGWSLQKIRTAIDALREVMNDPNPLKHAMLFHDKKTIIALYKTREGERILLDTLSAGRQQVMGIVLELLMEEAIQTMANRDSSEATKEVMRWQPSI